MLQRERERERERRRIQEEVRGERCTKPHVLIKMNLSAVCLKNYSNN